MLATTASFVGCKEDPKEDPTPSTNYEHSGFITADETWDANGIHILKDRIIVKEGVTLTINAGALIKGEVGVGPNASVLVIARGATINAGGTATDGRCRCWRGAPLFGGGGVRYTA